MVPERSEGFGQAEFRRCQIKDKEGKMGLRGESKGQGAVPASREGLDLKDFKC